MCLAQGIEGQALPGEELCMTHIRASGTSSGSGGGTGALHSAPGDVPVAMMKGRSAAEHHRLDTPADRGRKYQRVGSPFDELDGLADNDSKEIVEPVTPRALFEKAAAPVTLDATASLFDVKLKPIQMSMTQLKNNFSNLQMSIDKQMLDFKAEMRNEIKDLDARIQELERARSNAQTNVQSPDTAAHIAQMQKEIAMLRSGKEAAKEYTNKALTAVVGGMGECGDMDTARKRIEDKLWEAWLPRAEDIYSKGDFIGVIFCRFGSELKRDKVVKSIRRMSCNIGKNTVWCKPDMPLEECIPRGALFAIKKMMVEWGYAKKALGRHRQRKTLPGR